MQDDNTSHINTISRRDFLRLGGSAFASAALAGLALPRHAWAEPVDTTSSIVILHTNDIHCAVGNRDADMPPIGYAAVANYLKSQRALYGESNVTLVDAGDHVQGAPIGTLSKGEYLIQIMNQTGYDLACPGNHEFDYGMTQFMTNVQLASASNFNYLCCNFYDKRTNTRMLTPYTIKDYTCAGTTYKVAFIGVATPATLTSASPKSFWDNDTDRNIVYTFCEDGTGDALAREVQACVDEVLAAGADYVVLLAHLGQTGAIDIWRSDVLAAKTSGIDIIIDGHSHEEYVQTIQNSAGNSVIITQTGTKLASLGQIIINPAAGTISASTPVYETTLLIPSTTQKEEDYFEPTDFEQDDDTQSFIDAKQDELSKITSQVIGTSRVDLRVLNDDGSWLVRAAETNAGNFCRQLFVLRH